MTRRECQYCGAEFADRASHDRHLRDEHDDQLSDAEVERIYGRRSRRPSRRQLLASLGVLGLVAGVGAYTRFTGSDATAANEFGYQTLLVEGVQVPLVPIADAIEWHRDSDTVFADARGQTAFDQEHITGAVVSSAPSGEGADDPLADLSTDRRIVTYCGCPHHLSSLRAASLVEDGHRHTYALDEGFFAWKEAGYPVTGEASPSLYRIDGVTDPSYAGQFAWARHGPTGQREPSVIREDGRFAIDVRFYEVGPDSRVRLSTPGGERTGSLARLSDGLVEV